MSDEDRRGNESPAVDAEIGTTAPRRPTRDMVLRAILYGLPAVMLLIAVAPFDMWALPPAYFQILRLVVMVAAGTAGYVSHRQKRFDAAYTFVVVAVVFNPVLPFLAGSAQLWCWLDICATGVFCAGAYEIGVDTNARARACEARHFLLRSWEALMLLGIGVAVLCLVFTVLAFLYALVFDHVMLRAMLRVFLLG